MGREFLEEVFSVQAMLGKPVNEPEFMNRCVRLATELPHSLWATAQVAHLRTSFQRQLPLVASPSAHTRAARAT